MSVVHRYTAGIIIQHNIVQGVVISPGSPSPNITKRLDKYDVISDTWTQVTDMNTARAGFGMHIQNELIYAVGGTDGSVMHKSIEMYDTVADLWEYKTPMEEARCFFQSCINNYYIYVIGGVAVSRGETSITTTVERYNILLDEWETLSPMPTGVAFGFCHVVNDSIYVMNGFLDTIGQPNDQVLIYDTALDSWTTEDSFTDEEKSLYKRLLPFSFVNGNYIYSTCGLLNEVDELAQPPKTSLYFVPDSYRYDTANGTIERADSLFTDLPKSRYGGCCVSDLDSHYFLGGIDKRTNTLKYVELVDSSTSPFGYTDTTRLPKGRSSFGCAISTVAYGSDIYVSGGIVSNQQENYLFVLLDSLPKTVGLNGKETAAVNILCVDENGDTPSGIEVQLTGTANVSGNKAVLFTDDRISIQNGYGLATLLPRAEDANQSVSMTNDFSNGYSIVVKGSVLNDLYYGESEALPPEPATGTGGTATGGNTNAGTISLPNGVTLLKTYTSVITKDQQNQGAYLGGGEIGGIISLSAFNNLGSGRDTSINYLNTQPWLPTVIGRLVNNSGDYTALRAEIARMQNELPFGGSPILDALEQSFDIFEFDVTSAKRLVYLQTDGEENCSHVTVDDVVDRISSITGGKMFPVVSSVLRVIPSNLHLDQSIRDGSPEIDEIADRTGGSALYVISDADIDTYVRGLLTARGFIGSGIFSCNIDLGEEVRIDSILANFDIPDETSAFWRYSIGNDDGLYTAVSERVEPNQVLSLYKTNGRTIRFIAEFFASLTTDIYNAELISPPKLTSITITYHKKTVSYAYITPSDTVDEVHNIVISLDATTPEGSDITVGATSEVTSNWNDYVSRSKPAVDNNSRIVIPIRKAFDPIERYTLEALMLVDGFIFEAKYGKWAADSEVSVFDINGEEVSSTEYRAFPNKGYIVFNSKRTDTYTIEIRNKKHISVAAEITNRVQGEPIIITGAGYMYSTLEPKFLSQTSNILPDAINVLLTPQNPNKDSIFTANWTFYDLKGRSNKDSLIQWYVNDVVQSDIDNLQVWDNKDWNIVKSGDIIYFTVLPKASDGTNGRTTRSIPVKVN